MKVGSLELRQTGHGTWVTACGVTLMRGDHGWTCWLDWHPTPDDAVLSWCSTEIALQDEGAAEASDMIGGWQEALTERAEAAARARALAEAVSGG